MKKKLKSRSIIKRHLDDAFGDYIKKRDNFTCVQCKNTYQPTVGHLITRTWESTRWSEDNVFCQCAGCNMKHEYTPHLFINWYIEKHGLEKYQELCRKANDHSVHYSRPQLMELTEVYKQKLAKLDNQ